MPPSAPDLADNELLKLLREEAARLESRSVELQDSLERVETGLRTIRLQCASSINTRAPIMILPNEILADIFVVSVYSGQSFSLTNQTSAPNHPTEVMISHVCRHWRSLALGLPELWSTFVHRSSTNPDDVPTVRLASYLQRSFCQPLSVLLDLRECQEAHEEERLALLGTLLPHCNRWHRIGIFTDINTPLLNFQACLEDLEAPYLVQLCLHPTEMHHDYSDEDDDSDDDSSGMLTSTNLKPAILRGGAPLLSSVLLSAPFTYATLPPFANISTLQLETKRYYFAWQFDVDAFFTILKIPTLTNLSIRGMLVTLPGGLRQLRIDSPFSMPSLKHLRFCQNYAMLGVLVVLDAPLLESLIIVDVDLLELASYPNVLPFPSLRFLSLQDCAAIDLRGSIFLLQLSKYITHLAVTTNELPYNILNTAWSSDLNPSLVWSELTVATINMDFRITDQVPNINNFLTFLQKHGNGVAPLTLRIQEGLLNRWASLCPDQLAVLERKCNLHRLTTQTAIISNQWPPRTDHVHLDKPDMDEFDLNPFHIPLYRLD